MAAIAVPLVTALAPSIIDLIAGLVHKGAPVQEATLGPKTGPVKFANLFTDVMQNIVNAHAAGQIAGDVPSPDAVKLIMQAVISSMKLQGLLTGTVADDSTAAVAASPVATPTATVVAPKVKTAPGAQSFALLNGQTLTVSVA